MTRQEFAYKVHGEQMVQKLNEAQELLDILASKLSDHELMEEANEAADMAMELRILINDVKQE